MPIDTQNLCYLFGNQLNDRKDRFDKADIIEQSIEVYSNDRLMWVDDIGRDHVDTQTGLDLEFKYMTDGLFTKTGKEKKNIKVKLKNSLGENKGVFIEDPADFYILGSAKCNGNYQLGRYQSLFG